MLVLLWLGWTVIPRQPQDSFVLAVLLVCASDGDPRNDRNTHAEVWRKLGKQPHKRSIRSQ